MSAKIDSHYLTVAIKMYHEDFGVYPFDNQLIVAKGQKDRELTDDEYSQVFHILSGGNSKKVTYLRLENGEEYSTPWGESYKVILDFDGDGKISHNASEELKSDIETTVGV